VIEQTTAPLTPGSWKQAGFSTKAKFSVRGLASGTRYWFRVAALGTAGQGPWSQHASAIAG
jgi:chitodextrinase